MNNFIQIRLTHWLSSSNVSAKFTDGDGNSRRYPNVTPSSVKRLQNTVIHESRATNKFKVRLPHEYKEVGWVAYRR